MVLEQSCIRRPGRESLRKRWVLQLIGDFVCFEGRGLAELAPEAFAGGLECGRYLLQLSCDCHKPRIVIRPSIRSTST